MYDYGTFLGGIVIGQLGDKYGMRAMFMCPCLLIAAGLMLLVKYTLGSAVLGYYFVMFGIGVFQGGPYNMISGAIAIELSNTPALEGNKRAVSLLSSIIEGSGILVGAAFQVVIPYVGSDQLFMMFTIVTVLAALVSAFIMFREFKRKRE
jgi:sugar phosphate permease